MWQRCTTLLHRGQRLPQAPESLGQRLRVAKTAEFKQVQKLRTEKQETNAYHKAQYINAFVEAHSADMTHSGRVKARAAEADSPPLLTSSASSEAARARLALAALSRTLQPTQQNGSGSAESPLVARRSGAAAAPMPTPHTRQRDENVTFGAWRAVPPPLAKQAADVDFRTHCLLREATTPPAWSPHAVQRALSASGGSRMAADFGAHLQHVRTRRHRGESVDVTKLYARFRASRGAVDRAMRHEADTAGPVRDAFDSFAVQQLVRHLGWSDALDVLNRHLADCRDGAVSAAPARLVAVYAEAVRQAATDDGPSLAQLEMLIQHACAAGPARSRPKRLAPVAAAPVLSLLRGGRATTPGAVEALARASLIQQPSAHSRQYLPAIGWAEYLRALHRCGADLAAVQATTDQITDATRTKHGDTMLQSPHLWQAYMESCAVHHIQHAWDVFHENAPHYRVQRTPAMMAALMQTLLSSTDPRQWAKAEEVWKTVRHQSPTMLMPTASVMAALMHLRERQQDADALTALCTDFSGFYAYYGVTAEEWQSTGGASLQRDRLAAFERHGPARFRALVDRINELNPLQVTVPAVVVTQMQLSLTRLSQQRNRAAAPAESAGDEITAEMLAELM